MTESDVLVVGAGFAGASAALRLREAGLSVRVCEARSRVGGRAYSKASEALGATVELGGSWLTPGHDRLRQHAATCGVRLTRTVALRDRRIHDGTKLHHRAEPIERITRDPVMETIAADARRFARGESLGEAGHPLAGISFAQYLERLEPSAALRVELLAWWSISGAGDVEQVDASEFLSFCAHDPASGRPEGMRNVLTHMLEGGASALVERMLARSTAELVLDCEIASLARRGSAVHCVARDGRVFSARYAVIALPLNTLGRLELDVGLSAGQRDAIAVGHGGRASKLLLRLADAEPGTLATGTRGPLGWLFTIDSPAPGDALAVGFGPYREAGEWADPQRLERAIRQLLPESSLLAYEHHDWIADPFSRGTWLAALAAAPQACDPQTWLPHGPVVFATSDFAPREAGWFEGAIESGERAADAIVALARGEPGPAGARLAAPA